MAKKRDAQGNALASELAFQRILIRQGETLLRFENLWNELEQEDIVLTQLRVIMPGIEGGEYRVVLKLQQGDAKFVAFHNSMTLLEALVGLINRLENRTLKFKDDMYA
jgi:hypothetical protein